MVLFPHGTGSPLHWKSELASGRPNPDLDYFDAVLTEVQGVRWLDERRSYATGLSNGAMFTSVLLCERADVLAAAAPIAGLTDSDQCEPSRPVTALTVHGTADPILLFNGGVNMGAIPGGGGEQPASPTTTMARADLDGAGYPAAVRAIAARNGCDPEPTDTEMTAEVIHRVYDSPDGTDVEFFIVVGGGHSWPASEFSKSIGDIVGKTTDDLDATRDAWTFLQRFRLPA